MKRKIVTLLLILVMLSSIFGAGYAHDFITSGSGDFAGALGTTVESNGNIIYVKASATGENNGTDWNNAYTDLQSALQEATSGKQIWVAAGTYKPTSGNERTAVFGLVAGVAVYGGFVGTESDLSQRNWQANDSILSGDIGTEDNNLDNVYQVVKSPHNASQTTILDGFTITKGYADGLYYDSQGGGMFCLGSPTLNNLIFDSNTAVGSYSDSGGGGVYIFGSPVLNNVKFINNTFTGSMGRGGGGMHVHGAWSPTLNGVTFLNNSTSRSGGGIFARDGITLNLNNVVFQGNQAQGQGGGIYSYISTLNMKNVKFLGNSSGSHGGGIFNKGGITTIVNALFSGNASTGSGTYGGGINVDGGSVELANATFSANSSGHIGGAVMVQSGSLKLTNSILWNNSATPGYQDIYSTSAGTATVTYSTLNTFRSNITAGDGCIEDDPLFVNAAGGDFHLQSGSPCIDAGTNKPYESGGIAEGITTDLGGNMRIINVRVDMGPYEYGVALTTYTVTVSAYPTEGGTVEGGGTFDVGDEVTVTATPNEGYRFVNWTDDGNNDVPVSTDAIYKFDMPAKNVNYTANFEEILPETYTVTVSANPAEGGEVTGDGSFNAGEEVTVTATPKEGYRFVNWTDDDDEGAIVSTVANYTFEMPANDLNYTANFEVEEIQPETYTVTVSAAPPKGGTVEGGGTFDVGDEVTVTATPNEGYRFVSWTENGKVVSLEAEYTFDMSEADRTLVAKFEAESKGKPDKPEKPDKPDEPGKPDKPEKPDKPVEPEKPDKPEKPVKDK
jgi:uncharacterized repeat protein (TIGR02543 family)